MTTKSAARTRAALFGIALAVSGALVAGCSAQPDRPPDPTPTWFAGPDDFQDDTDPRPFIQMGELALMAARSQHLEVTLDDRGGEVVLRAVSADGGEPAETQLAEDEYFSLGVLSEGFVLQEAAERVVPGLAGASTTYVINLDSGIVSVVAGVESNDG